MKIKAGAIDAIRATGPSAIVGRDVQQVIVRDIDIPFWRIVGIMLKWTFAAIPAIIILAVIFLALTVGPKSFMHAREVSQRNAAQNAQR